MFISALLLPDWWLWLSGLVAATAFAVTVARAPWMAITQTPGRIHLLLGATMACTLLWLMSVPASDGLRLHLLGAATLTLLVGLRFALLTGALATLLYALALGESLAGLPTAWLISVVLPALTVRCWLSLLQRSSSRNPFLFMLGAGFGGAILSSLVLAVASVSLFGMMERSGWVEGAFADWPLIALMAFPEGFINGMAVTVLCVFHPNSMKLLDEQRYFDTTTP